MFKANTDLKETETFSKIREVYNEMHFKDPKIERIKPGSNTFTGNNAFTRTGTIATDDFIVKGEIDKDNKISCQLNGIEYIE